MRFHCFQVFVWLRNSSITLNITNGVFSSALLNGNFNTRNSKNTHQEISLFSNRYIIKEILNLWDDKLI